MPLSAHEFERRLIFYASPTLTKLKVACMYNLNDLDDLEECLDYYNDILIDNLYMCGEMYIDDVRNVHR